MAAGGAVTLGLLASIATSQASGGTTRETTRFYLQAAALSEETSEVVRFCPASRFTFDRVPVIYELTVRGQLLQGASVPVVLSVDGYSRAKSDFLTLGGLDETRTLRVSVVRDTTDHTQCSPWGRVTVGPFEGDPGEGIVQWRLAITADVFPADPPRRGEASGDLEFGNP